MKQEVTIIVPVFNEKETVLQTLQDLCSHLTHSRISFEMIVVDDGSDDGSADEIKKIDHPGLRIITHEKNRDMAPQSNRNTGINH